MWEKGKFAPNMQNPWVGEPNAAPFNREFHLILNVAVGGTNAYFPDGSTGKPWSDTDPHSVNAFYNSRGAWQQTWKGEGAAMRIDSIKVWSFDEEEPTTF
jgi:hypothetical protein